MESCSSSVGGEVLGSKVMDGIILVGDDSALDGKELGI
jgi:hypothetical protein